MEDTERVTRGDSVVAWKGGRQHYGTVVQVLQEEGAPRLAEVLWDGDGSESCGRFVPTLGLVEHPSVIGGWETILEES